MVRTVSMLPAATEIVVSLGLLDQLVAVSHECDFPPEVNAIPRATHCEIHGQKLSAAEIDRWVSRTLRSGKSLYLLDEPLLRTLAPDLILTQKLCDVCAPAYGSVAALAAALPTRPQVLNLEPKSLAGIFDTIRAVAGAMGHPERAAGFITALQRRVDAVRARVADLPQPSVFVMEWADPIFNAGHWTPELVRLAGGVSILSKEGSDSVRVSWDALRDADPEVLVIACCGHGIERTRQDLRLLEKLPGWAELRAVRSNKAHLADGSAYFSRPGPRVVEALEWLAEVLHPTCA